MRGFTYRPYTLYAYRQTDGRITFVVNPYRDALLVNVRQMRLKFDSKADCNLILLSWDKDFLFTWDARYNVELDPRLESDNLRQLTADGQPLVLMARGRRLRIEPLDQNYFMTGKR